MKAILRILILLLIGIESGLNSSNRWGYDYEVNPSKLYGSDNSDLLCITSVCGNVPSSIILNKTTYILQIGGAGTCANVYGSSTTVAMCDCTTDLSKSPTDFCINITMLGTPETLNISVYYDNQMESYTIAKISDIEMSSSTSAQTSDPSPSSSTPSSTNAPSPSDPSTTIPSGPSTTSSSRPSTTTTSGPSSPGNYAAGSHNPTLGITFLMTMLVLFL
ncbi:PREDICTED: A-agglutinin anchorage subunit-like [Amphimedon queenslandica]|uniref:Uncharacterized protein n=1 Tax=Amphimedon queenslandica TaxID=400682 RepID=A0A1X7T866_AMPQE|nr:PREDICTED: A-agglutinin anchorage subunit-like [Amphimedon queenslandica]|eukprot:XP_019860945.1 PREDICTED: A-agglutinin anchorage subunit-like [Amphimedon queenslandica]